MGSIPLCFEVRLPILKHAAESMCVSCSLLTTRALNVCASTGMESTLSCSSSSQSLRRHSWKVEWTLLCTTGPSTAARMPQPPVKINSRLQCKHCCDTRFELVAVCDRSVHSTFLFLFSPRYPQNEIEIDGAGIYVGIMFGIFVLFRTIAALVLAARSRSIT